MVFNNLLIFLYNLIIISLSVLVLMFHKLCIQNTNSLPIPCSMEGLSCQNISCCHNLICYENTACISNNSYFSNISYLNNISNIFILLKNLSN